MDFDNQNAFDFVGNQQVDDIDGFDPIQQNDVLQEEEVHMDDMFGFAPQSSTPQPQGQPMFFQPEPSPSNSTQSAAAAPPASAPALSSAKQQWDEKKAKQLKERAAKQKAAHEQSVANGRKELQDFQDKRRTTVAKTKSTNRSEETQSRTDLEGTLKNGTEWEKVAKYCDLKPKHDPKIAQQPNNTERMRSLIIDLKNEKK